MRLPKTRTIVIGAFAVVFTVPLFSEFAERFIVRMAPTAPTQTHVIQTEAVQPNGDSKIQQCIASDLGVSVHNVSINRTGPFYFYPGGPSSYRDTLYFHENNGSETFVTLTLQQKNASGPYTWVMDKSETVTRSGDYIIRREDVEFAKTQDFGAFWTSREKSYPDPTKQKTSLDVLELPFEDAKTIFVHDESAVRRMHAAKMCAGTYEPA